MFSFFRDQRWGFFRLNQKALEEGQTSDPRLAALRREVADHPSFGLTPQKLAATFAAAEEGDLTAQADLFLDMEEKDAHLFAEMSKRRRALLSLPWRIAPPHRPTPGEKKAAEASAEVFADVPAKEDILLNLMDGCGHGFSALEVTWRRQGRLWRPKNLEHQPQRLFQLDKATRTKIRLRDGSQDGADLLPFGWVLHTHRAKPGYIARSGLLRVLSWPYLFKALSIRDLAELLEIYGIPMRLGTYQPGASDDDKRKLMAAVVGIGHRAAGIIPAGMQIDFKGAAEGNHQPFLEFAAYMDRMISKAILGGTLTSGTDGGGAYALGEIHNEVRHELLISDARQVQDTLTRDLLYPLAALNGFAPDGPTRAPRFEFVIKSQTAAVDLNTFSLGISRLATLMGDDPKNGIPVSWVREQTGIPAPNEEAVLVSQKLALEPAQTAAGNLPTSAAPEKAALRAGAAGQEGHPADALAERLAAEAAPAVAAWAEHLAGLARSAGSLEELRAAVLAAYGDLPSAALAQALEGGLMAAQAAGRFDVEQGAGE
jgi:phage gp29-like protein